MSVYDEDEPFARMLTGTTRQILRDGCTIDVTALATTGLHSGRRRFRVFCSTCRVEVHEATTGPGENIEMHLRRKAAVRKEAP